MTDLYVVPPPPYDYEREGDFPVSPSFPCGYCGAPAGEPCRDHETFAPMAGVLIGSVIGVLIGLALVCLWVLA